MADLQSEMPVWLLANTPPLAGLNFRELESFWETGRDQEFTAGENLVLENQLALPLRGSLRLSGSPVGAVTNLKFYGQWPFTRYSHVEEFQFSGFARLRVWNTMDLARFFLTHPPLLGALLRFLPRLGHRLTNFGTKLVLNRSRIWLALPSGDPEWAPARETCLRALTRQATRYSGGGKVVVLEIAREDQSGGENPEDLPSGEEWPPGVEVTRLSWNPAEGIGGLVPEIMARYLNARLCLVVLPESLALSGNPGGTSGSSQREKSIGDLAGLAHRVLHFEKRPFDGLNVTENLRRHGRPDTRLVSIPIREWNWKYPSLFGSTKNPEATESGVRASHARDQDWNLRLRPLFAGEAGGEPFGLSVNGGLMSGFQMAGALARWPQEHKPALVVGAGWSALGAALFCLNGGEPRNLDSVLRRHMEDISPKRFFEILFPKSALFRGDKLLERLYNLFGDRHFQDLEIPLFLRLADMANGRVSFLGSGKLVPALYRSLQIPGLLADTDLEEGYPVNLAADLASGEDLVAGWFYKRGLGRSLHLLGEDNLPELSSASATDPEGELPYLDRALFPYRLGQFRGRQLSHFSARTGDSFCLTFPLAGPPGNRARPADFRNSGQWVDEGALFWSQALAKDPALRGFLRQKREETQFYSLGNAQISQTGS